LRRSFAPARNSDGPTQKYLTAKELLVNKKYYFTFPISRQIRSQRGQTKKTLCSIDLFIINEEMGTRIHIGDFELVVMLVLLRLGDGAYGVPISREVEQRCGREVALGSVYATLERLQEKGLVSSQLGEPTPERGGRAKRYFRLTRKGLREVRETKDALVRLWSGLPELAGGKI
jgi:PadR family transcriptional regulator, regulatory protein PadR